MPQAAGGLQGDVFYHTSVPQIPYCVICVTIPLRDSHNFHTGAGWIIGLYFVFNRYHFIEIF